MIKNIIALIFLLQICLISVAQQVDCSVAEDSILSRKNRGEISYYYPAKYLPDVYFYLTFKNNRYSRKQMPVNSLSKEFLTCYNKSTQKELDSVFKVDFFRKIDSILNVFDKDGRGYRNIDLPGGASELQKFMKKNVTLPKGAKPIDADLLIRVYYSFMVDETGKISDITLIKSNCKECEEHVLAAVKKLPPFIPASEAGYPKTVKYILPYFRKF